MQQLPPGFQLDTQAQPSQFPGVIRGPAKAPDPATVEERNYDRNIDQRDYNTDRGDKAFDQKLKLKDDFAKLDFVKEFPTVARQYSFALQTQPTPSGDQALIVAYAKMLDPASVVREAEFDVTAAADSALGRTVSRIKRELGMDGGGRLSEEARQKVRAEMRTLFKQYDTQYQEARGYYTDLAGRNGFDPVEILGPDYSQTYSEAINAYWDNVEGAAVAGNQTTTAQDQTRYATEEDRRKSAGLRQLYVSGASLDDMVDYLKAQGEPVDFNVLRSLKENIDFRDGRGDYQGVKPTRQDLERQVITPQTGTRSGLGAAIAEGATTMPGAFVTGFMDLHGGLDEIVAGASGADLDRVNQNKQAIREANPGSYFAGQVVGNLSAGAAAARLAPNVARAAVATPRAAAGTAAAIGGVQGALEQNDNRILGGATGAAFGGALGYGGARIGNALAQRATTQAAQAPARNALADAGQAEGVTVNRAMIDPSLENRFAAAEARAGSGPRINAEMDRIQGQVETRVRDLGQGRPAPQREAMGATVQAAANRNVDNTRARASRLYDRADQAAGGVSVQPQRAIQAIDQNIAELQASGANANSGQIRYLQDLKGDLEKGMTVRGLRDLRTNMRGQINERNLNATDAERRIGQVVDAASEDISVALGKSPAGKLYKQADDLWREQADFSKQIREALVGPANNPKSGTQAAAKIESFIRDDPKRFERLWSGMEEAERGDLRAFMAESLGTDAKGEFSPAIFLNNLPGGSRQSLSQRSAKLIFGEEGAKSLENLKLLATEVNRLNAQRGRGSARANNYRNWLFDALGLLGGGGIMALAGGGSVGTLAAGAAGAAAVAGGRAARDAIDVKALMSPEITRWIRQAPKTTNPKAIDAHYKRLLTIAGGQTPAAETAKMLSEMIMKAANDNAGMSAVAEQQVAEEQP